MSSTHCTCIRSTRLAVLYPDPDCPAYTIHAHTELKETT